MYHEKHSNRLEGIRGESTIAYDFRRKESIFILTTECELSSIEENNIGQSRRQTSAFIQH